MSAFSDLLQVRTPKIWWVVRLGGFDRDTGDARTFYLVKDDNFRRDIGGGEIVPFRGVWERGQEITWTESIVRAAGDANRSFLATGRSTGGEHRFRIRPDKEMMPQIRLGGTVDLRGGTFDLFGWGPEKADGTAFPFSEADHPIRGKTIDLTAKGDGIFELSYVDEFLDFDEPVQTHLFGGFGTAQDLIASSAAPILTRHVKTSTSAFDIDGTAFTWEMFCIADTIPSSEIIGEEILAISGDPDSIDDCSWGLLMGSGAVLTFAAKAVRLVTSFVVPEEGWFSAHVSLGSDGKTVKVYAGSGRARSSVSLVGTTVLAAAVSPASGTQEFAVGTSFVTDFAWGMRWAEGRFWLRELGLQEINERRLRTMVPSDSPRPRNLYRFSGSDSAVVVDEDGSEDLDAIDVNSAPIRIPTGDGPLPDAFDGDLVGRTIAWLAGRRKNVIGEKVSEKFDSYGVALGLSLSGQTAVHEARSAEAPFTLDRFMAFTFNTGSVADSISISDIGGQEDLTFFMFLQPDGDPTVGPVLPGQVIRFIKTSAPSSSDLLTISEISDDGRTIFVEEDITSDFVEEPGSVRTPLTGSSKFAGEEDVAGEQVIVDRGTLVNFGQVTFEASGFQGDTTDSEETNLGLFESLLRETFGLTGVVTALSSFLEVGPVGLYLPLGGSQSFRASADEVAFPGWWRYEPGDETYTLGGYTIPGDAAVGSIGELDIDSLEEITRQRPFKSLTVRFAVNDEIQDRSSAAGGVPTANRNRFANKGQTITLESGTKVRTALDQKDPIETLAFDIDGAILIANRVGGLVFRDLSWHRMKTTSLKSYDFRTGDEITVTWADESLGFDGGKNIIIGSIAKSTNMTIVYEGWSSTATIVTYGLTGEDDEFVTYGQEGEPDEFVTY